jgi:enoyl-CoA hydratase/carnithine racemase
MKYNTLDWAVNNRILTLTLTRPEQLNSFTVEMANELVDARRSAVSIALTRQMM